MRKLVKRGFTLVELMIVVAIIGVLAALAIYGVRKYLLSSKTSEAKNTIGAINRAAVSAYERERLQGQLLTAGQTSNIASHTLCNTSSQVPTTGAPAGKKYQPDTADSVDFNTGDDQTGWKCLRFTLTEPVYYSYMYEKSGSSSMIAAGATKTIPAGTEWLCEAAGDLDGNGQASWFAQVGAIRNGQPVTSTTVIEDRPEE